MRNSSTNPEISVVIPARNEEATIEAALQSVDGQTLAPIEVLVVANDCQDKTAVLARAFTPGPMMEVIVLEDPRPGLARSKNLGARQARGEFLLFLDGDSRLGPGLLDEVRARIAEGCDVGSIPVYSDGGDLIDRGFFGLMEFGKRLFNIHAQMFFCRRESFVEAGGFNEGLQLGEDRDLLQRFQRRGLRFCRIQNASIATSPRRLHRLPLRLGVPVTFLRWSMANWHLGRRWRY